MYQKKIKTAVLALQGAFAEHERMLRELGADTIELRQKKDLEQDFDALVLPGGESTVQGKLLRELDMFEPLKEKIRCGMPVLATCAGMILLADRIEADEKRYFETLPVTVKRNAYGRQLGSFSMKGRVDGVFGGEFPMEFIRAPFITEVGKNTKVLAEDEDGHVVGVRYENQFAYAFHPELTGDTRIHKGFLEFAASI